MMDEPFGALDAIHARDAGGGSAAAARRAALPRSRRRTTWRRRCSMPTASW
ncbi:hypothetical protein AB5I41_23025 [Sphingomonas sp. MMS24-JH45]